MNVFRNSLLFAFVLVFADLLAFSQTCNLLEDRKDSYGKIIRSVEWRHTDQRGNSLELFLGRYGDKYSFLFSLDQPISGGDAVSFSLDADVHSVNFLLDNGGIVKGWISQSGSYKNEQEGDKLTYSEEYAVVAQNVGYFGNSKVVAIVFRCSGREVFTGNAVNEIRFPIPSGVGQRLSRAFQCLSENPKEEKRELTIAPVRATKNNKEVKKTGDDSTDELLRRLITTVGESGASIKESVEQSGTSQLEQSFLLAEKLEKLSDAIDALNETKEEVSEITPRVFGFGVYFKSNYYFSEVFVPFNVDADLLSAKFLAGTSINMSFNAGMKKRVGFRFEPHIDFLFSNNNQNINNNTQRSKSSAQQIEGGLRLLLVVRRNRVNIYPGITGGYVNLLAKSSNESIGSVNYTRQKAERHGGSIGLVFGGEYLVTPHFGIRLESGLLYYILGNQTSTTKVNSGSGEISNSDVLIIQDGRLSTFGRLGGSFYF